LLEILMNQLIFILLVDRNMRRKHEKEGEDR